MMMVACVSPLALYSKLSINYFNINWLLSTKIRQKHTGEYHLEIKPIFLSVGGLLLRIIFLPSFLAGGFLVAQLVRIDRDPSHWPFIKAMAFSASTFFIKDTKP